MTGIPSYLEQVKAARRVSTPLIAISTPDPLAAIELLIANSAETTAAFTHDVARGLRPGNAAAEQYLVSVLLDQRTIEATQYDASAREEALTQAQQSTMDPTQMLMEFAPRLPELAVLYLIHHNRYLADQTASGAGYVQALFNLREPYKADTRTAILLAPAFQMPPELSASVLPLDEPLPSDAELGKVLDSYKPDVTITDAERLSAVDALRGLAAYAAEQAVAMSVEGPKGAKRINGDLLWERKRKLIETTPGLSVWRGREKFADVGGSEQVKKFFRLLINGPERVGVAVFFDEIDKQFGGATTDSSGVTQAQHGKFLTYTQDRRVQGVRLIGPPGTGKSAIAKAIAGEAGVLCIQVDLGSAKGSLVGQSEAQLDAILKVVDAVGGGKALFVATCNREGGLSPELKRRLPQVFYFDLPDETEKAAIWPIWLKNYNLPLDAPRPDDRNWTGAEIAQACTLAYRLNIPLKDTAQFIVPVATSMGEELDALRAQAHGRFLSASKPGVYQRPGSAMQADSIARAVAKARGRTLTDKEV